MSEYSMQYGCSPLVGDFGPLTIENLAIGRLLLGNVNITDSGVIFWRDSSYVPQVGTITGAVDGLLEPSDLAGVVTIAGGVAIVNGYLYLSDEPVEFDIDSNPGNLGATDRIVLRWDSIAQTVRLTRVAGAAGNTAVLTQNSGVWDIPIARVVLDGGAGEFLSLIDDRKLAMPTGTVMMLDEIVSEGASTMAFANIPNIFNHLRVVTNLRFDGSNASEIFVARFNGIGTNTYDSAVLLGQNSAVSHTTTFGVNQFLLGSVTSGLGSALAFDSYVFDILNYKNPDIYKTLLWRGGWIEDADAATFATVQGNGRWANIDPITSVTLFSTPSLFPTVAGSIATLYGVV